MAKLGPLIAAHSVEGRWYSFLVLSTACRWALARKIRPEMARKALYYGKHLIENRACRNTQALAMLSARNCRLGGGRT
jgi:hypothetical protein